MNMIKETVETRKNTKFLEETLKGVKKVFDEHTNEKYRYKVCENLVNAALDYVDAVQLEYNGMLHYYDDVAHSALWAISTMFSEECSIDAIEAYVTDTLLLLDRIREAPEIEQVLIEDVDCVYIDTQVVVEVKTYEQYRDVLNHGFTEEYNEGNVYHAYNDDVGMCVIYIDDDKYWGRQG